MKTTLLRTAPLLAAALLALAGTRPARADVITDWNDKACEIVATVGQGAPGHRLMAVVQGAVFEAVNAIDPRYAPSTPGLAASRRASVEAAVAAANRATLLALVPAEKAAIEAAYKAALDAVPDGEAEDQGVAVGERAAALLLARAASDGAGAPERYQWSSAPGRYAPTVVPAAVSWPGRRPWVMDSASQFRPAPPPALSSDTWARDLQEVRTLGEKTSTLRTPRQTEAARFWQETRPLIYFPLLHAVARLPGRSPVQNARLYAAAALANDDALIAVFDAKYHYSFWRPIAAARTAHVAGGNRVEAEPGWTPLIGTPLHPEYPCAHCVLAGAVGAVIEAELQGIPAPRLTTRSPSAPGLVHEWQSVAAMVDEVKGARIWGGVHYRHSAEVGADMGAAIGALVQRRFAPPAPL